MYTFKDIMIYTKKKIISVLSLAFILILQGCSNDLQSRLEEYIETNCDFEKNDTCYFNMKHVVGDYDNIYFIYPVVPLMPVRNIIGVKDFRDCDSPETALLCNMDDYYQLIIVKDKHVVYEGEYDFSNIKICYDDFPKVSGSGIFDDSEIEVSAYTSSDSIFQVTRTIDKMDKFYKIEQVIK